MSLRDSKYSGKGYLNQREISSDDESEDYFIAEEPKPEEEEEDEDQCLTPDDTPTSIRKSTGLENYFTRLALEGEPAQSLDDDLGNVDVKDELNINNVDCLPSIKNSTTCFAKIRETQGNALNIIYNNDVDSPKKSNLFKSKDSSGKAKHTSFAALPNSTTWQKLSATNASYSQNNCKQESSMDNGDGPIATQLLNIRLKLEDKRRKFEQDKRKMEMLCKHQRQKLSKAAFLKAITKASVSEAATPESDSSKEEPISEDSSLASDIIVSNSTNKQFHIQEIAEHLDCVSKKWLKSPSPSEHQDDEDEDSTDTMNSDEYQTSIELLNSSLTDLQEDIATISHQEKMLQAMMTTSNQKPYNYAAPPQQSYYPMPPSSFPNTLQNQWKSSPALVPNYNSPLPYNPMPSNPQGPPPMDDYRWNFGNMRQGSWDSQTNYGNWDNPAPYPMYPASNYHSAPYNPHNHSIKGNFYPAPPQPHPQQPTLAPRSTNRSFQEPPSHLEDSDISETDHVHIPQPQAEEAFPVKTKSKSTSNSSEKPNASPRPHNVVKEEPPRTQQQFYVSFDSETPVKPKPKPKFNQQQQQPTLPKTQQQPSPLAKTQSKTSVLPIKPPPEPCIGFVIGADLVAPNPETQIEMEKKKEVIMMMSIKRKAVQENKRIYKEAENTKKREEERIKKELIERRKEEKRIKHQAILEQYLEKKAQKEADAEGIQQSPARARPKSSSKPRPKSVHVVNMNESGNHHHHSNNHHGSEIEYSEEAGSLHSLSRTSSSVHDSLPLSCRTMYYEDCGSTTSSTTMFEYTGPKLFVKPAAKSNRTIITNAINTVLAGTVNSQAKARVLNEIHVSQSKHFLILFRDAGCQFRALYTYNPDHGEVNKLYGTGPRGVTEKMIDKYYKYNSGGKCFSQVHTKHLSVTIDAITIHNSIWTGKKVTQRKLDYL